MDIISKNNSNSNEETVDEQKNKLKKQINELKSLISQMEGNLNILKFGQIKCVNSEPVEKPNHCNIPDVNIELEYQMYKYSGFYCVKSTENEYVFHFSCSSKYTKDIFAVQILIDEGKGKLGKWVMPKAIHLEDVVSQYPIDDIKYLPRFLKICKHYLNCYFLRHEQYNTLKDIVSDIKNCNLQTNLGYTQFILELKGVYDAENDSSLQIVIYLLYNVNQIRSHKIKVYSTTKDELDETTEKQLKASLGGFKKLDLCEAFRLMLRKKPFIWTREDDEDSPLEISAPSESEEEFLKISFSKSQKIERKRKQSKNVAPNKRQKGHSITNRNHNVAASTSEKSVRESAANLKQDKLKQTKLNFKSKDLNSQTKNNDDGNKIDSAGENNESTLVTDVETSKKISNPFTSTPMHSSMRQPCINISDITVDENRSNIPIKMQLGGNQSPSRKSKRLLQTDMKKKLRSFEKTKLQNSKKD